MVGRGRPNGAALYLLQQLFPVAETSQNKVPQRTEITHVMGLDLVIALVFGAAQYFHRPIWQGRMTFSFSMVFTKRFWIVLAILIALALFFVLRTTAAQVAIENLTPPKLPAAQSASKRVMLDQNWSPEVSERFHFVSQGTSTLPIPYEWLLALEEPNGSVWGLLWPGAKPLFTANTNMERYGFISSAPSVQNPDGLPIGFAKTPYQNLDGYPTTTTSVGFTCAACHTGRFLYEDTEFVVNGGPAVTDLGVFSKGLAAALGQTLVSSKLPLPDKRFDRFAKRVLGEAYSETAKAGLAKDLDAVVKAAARSSDIIDVVEGYGRLDALNRIGNQVFSKNLGRRENYTPINAPVNYPHIWTASWFDWVQYDGSIMQPLIRNAGEALGVHAPVVTNVPKDQGRFSSAIPIEEVVWIEETLAGPTPPLEAKAFGGLDSPKWPDALGAIDQAKADQGAALYNRHCAGCHLPPLNSDAIWSDTYFKPIEWEMFAGPQVTDDAYLNLKIIDQAKIGTDPAQANILLDRKVNTAQDAANDKPALGLDTLVCAPRPQYAGPSGASTGYDAQVNDRARGSENTLGPLQVSDGPMISFAFALGAIVQEVNEEGLNARNIPLDLRPALEGDRPNCLQAGAGYKARPLNGVWATAPFLHNGSVPTLDDLLRPADQRPTYVRLGDWTFDPVKVGLSQPNLSGDSYPTYKDGFFVLDTRVDGNRNTGHAFGANKDGSTVGVIGPEFSDTDREALIEFLKTL